MSVLVVLFLGMIGIGFGSINRADFGALGRIKVPLAFNTFSGVDDISSLALADSLHGTFGFACSAADALVRNLVSHEIYLLNILKNPG
jgi:hypothetical protein